MTDAPLIDAPLRDELAALYAAPDRHYHGLSHIEAMLELARIHRTELADPEAVEAAIWFHDAVYDSRAKDNEAASAALAVERLGGRIEPTRLARIAAMIEATAHHHLPDLDTEQARADAALFLDMDLAILGAAPDVFDAYEEAVRREYDWVPEPLWRSGRAGVLAGFLERQHFFHTDLFRERLEAQARANVARSIARLS